MHLDRSDEGRVALLEHGERSEQIDVRPRQEVDRRIRHPSEQATNPPCPSMPQTLLRVHRARVDDPEDAVWRRLSRRLEIRRVEAHRDAVDAFPELRKGGPDASRRLGRVHDDRRRAPQDSPHPSAVGEALKGRRIDPHLVERPRVVKVRDPRRTCLPDRVDDARCGVVRHDLPEDDVGTRQPEPRDRLDELRVEPSAKRRVELQHAFPDSAESAAL